MSKRLIDIIEIEVNKLYPHPKNPREDVGDISELAESIKSTGIMQNLTVIHGGPGVPDGKDGYTVIIGHRRRAAAIKAGIDTVPCAVVEMDEKSQVSTMLLENMQRSDLTVYEQAQGIQMMIDLGESVKDISEKTGFSLSTIDRRRKLLSLNKEKFKASVESGATLNDYLKISEIEDEDDRNRLLSVIGSNNFNYEYNNAIGRQRRRKNKDKILKSLPDGIVVSDNWGELPAWNSREEIARFDLINEITDEQIDDVLYKMDGEGKYFCFCNDYMIYLYKEISVEEQKAAQVDEEKEQEKRELEERRNKLDSINKTFFNMRKEFFENFKATKQNEENVIKFAGITRSCDDWSEYEVDELCRLLGVEYSTPDEDETDIYEYDGKKIKECFDKNPLQALYAQAFLCLEDKEDNRCYQYWNCEYSLTWHIHIVYKGLEILGYEMSDEEKSYIDGTHELFAGE